MTSSSSFSLRDKSVVQSGGTGLISTALIEATLVVASRNREGLAPADARAPETGRAFQIEAVDIHAESSLRDLRDRVLRQHGPIDGVVYNAVNRPMKSMEDTLNARQESMNTNANPFFRPCEPWTRGCRSVAVGAS